MPNTFREVLNNFTRNGYRVLGLAKRVISAEEWKRYSAGKDDGPERDDLELNLEFLGLLVMENRLKPDTAGVITQLSEAAIRTVMVTGKQLNSVSLLERLFVTCYMQWRRQYTLI